MANGTETQIDKLGIDISVRENDAAAKITAVAKAINQLKNSLASLTDVSKQMNKLTQMFSSLKIPNGIDKKAPQAKQSLLKKINVNEETGEISKISLATSNEVVNKNYKMATSQAEYNEELKKTKKLQDDNNKETKKSAGAFSKFVRSVGRVAFYRAIRTALKEIVQAAKEGLQNLREVNPELNKAMNQISLAGNSLKNSFASILAPILQTLAPLITEISDHIAEYINNINEANAALQGQDTYTRILTSDTKEYQDQLEKMSKKQGGLLSFDTFTKQSGTNSYTGVIKETVKMTKEQAKAYGSVFETLGNIKPVLVDIKDIVIEIIDLVKDLVYIWNRFDVLSSLTDVTGIIKGLAQILKGIVSILKGDFPEAFDALGEGFVNLIKGITKAILKNNVISLLLKLFGVDVDSKVDNLFGDYKPLIRDGGSRFANGGNYNTGDYFVANENGKTELVASSNSGGGSVMNLDQWASISYSSFYRALSDYDAAQNGRGGELDINSLGRTIAANTGFVNEMNRRNANLNLI